MAARLSAMGNEAYFSVDAWNGTVCLVLDALKKPYGWKKPRSIFVGSMGDVFLETVSFSWVDRIMKMVWDNPQHTFILLTKRAERMREYFEELSEPGTNAPASKRLLELPSYGQEHHGWHMKYLRGEALPNLVLGVSAEHQEAADERIPELLATPAAKRFVSLEPMIAPIDLSRIHESGDTEGGGAWHSWESCLTGRRFDPWSDGEVDGYPKLDGVILGGESGHGARLIHPEWVRTVRDQCAATGVPFMFKQWGANVLSEHDRPWEFNFPNGFPDLDGKEHSAFAWFVR
jgi:protein gp37